MPRRMLREATATATSRKSIRSTLALVLSVAVVTAIPAWADTGTELDAAKDRLDAARAELTRRHRALAGDRGAPRPRPGRGVRGPGGDRSSRGRAGADPRDAERPGGGRVHVRRVALDRRPPHVGLDPGRRPTGCSTRRASSRATPISPPRWPSRRRSCDARKRGSGKPLGWRRGPPRSWRPQRAQIDDRVQELNDLVDELEAELEAEEALSLSLGGQRWIGRWVGLDHRHRRDPDLPGGRPDLVRRLLRRSASGWPEPRGDRPDRGVRHAGRRRRSRDRIDRRGASAGSGSSCSTTAEATGRSTRTCRAMGPVGHVTPGP